MNLNLEVIKDSEIKFGYLHMDSYDVNITDILYGQSRKMLHLLLGGRQIIIFRGKFGFYLRVSCLTNKYLI
jgi:hypothetical protein